MLFATQNPPGLYGGRKVLSRAFRNRFLELHFDDIPEDELEIILQKRSLYTAPSDCKRIVNVYKELSRLRQTSRLFENKDSFATLRDLFRWALRAAETREEIAANGFMLLAERVRNEEERIAVKKVIEMVFKVKIDQEQLYDIHKSPYLRVQPPNNGQGVVWTRAMRRLYVLVASALRHNEPVLLVGETGCGKTTVCQLLAESLGKKLHIVNAHQNTETGDLIGSQRPIRNRGAILDALTQDLTTVLEELGQMVDGDVEVLLGKYHALDKSTLSRVPVDLQRRISDNEVKIKALFEWADGSLVHAMRDGQFFLLDEISLADDSVLERLNSVLEPQRTLLLAEKGIDDSFVKASDGFQFLATMNPGGDFGKKELSPALRNRFTEIWVSPLSANEDVLHIVSSKLKPEFQPAARVIVEFSYWFGQNFRSTASTAFSIRDILVWVKFINESAALSAEASVVHGAATVFIDTLGANPSALIAIDPKSMDTQRQKCLDKLSELLGCDATAIYRAPPELAVRPDELRIGDFSIKRVANENFEAGFALHAPTTKLNAMRIIRALQVQKPILLEGSPGVGKTTLNGEWVLLDEMNLASQSVLEGLNACLDHRGEVYVSELDQVFKKHPDFRLFAAQNPHHQGGGRKGLPSSFVNRFIVVYADVFSEEDLLLIAEHNFPTIPPETVRRMINFISNLETRILVEKAFGSQGSPWEFNLRDTLRWLHLLTSSDPLLKTGKVDDFLNIAIRQRFRTERDRLEVDNLFTETFEAPPKGHQLYHSINSSLFQVGLALVQRNKLLQLSQFPSMDVVPRLVEIESLLICINQNIPCILVGPSGSGKSMLLQHIAASCGKSLVTFPMNADIDAIDLVGGFEQSDPMRDINAALRQLREALQLWTASTLVQGALGDAVDLLNILGSMTNQAGVSQSLLDRIGKLLAQLPETSDLAVTLSNVHEILQRSISISNPKFEWLDGIIVQALQKGDWLVLDNANLCSASVLDRLNSLLEPGGYLIINEHCGPNGEPRIIKPHPDFRVFLTVDPRYGELSRAMRNRAIEIYIEPHSSATPFWRSRVAEVESSLKRYESQLAALSFDIENNSSISDVAVDSLSFDDLPLLNKYTPFDWQPQAMSLLQRGEVMERRFRGAQLDFNGAKQVTGSYLRSEVMVNILTTIRQLYAPLAGTIAPTFEDMQPIYPLQNSVIVPCLQSDLAQLPFWLAACYDRHVDIVEARRRLSLEDPRGKGFRVSELNRLQRSCIADTVAAASKDSTVGAYRFLSNILDGIYPFMQANMFNADFWRDRAYFCRDVMNKWWTALDFLTAPRFSEAGFQAYLSLFSDRLSDYISHGADDGIRNLASGILRTINDTFVSGFKLSTGLSMEILWEGLRPIPIKDELLLDNIRQMERLAAQFDSVKWKSTTTLSDLANIMTSFVKVYQLIRLGQPNVETLLGTLTTEIEQLVSKLGDDGTAASPFMAAEFETIRQIILLDSMSCREDLPQTSGEVVLLSSLPLVTQMRTTSASTTSKLLLSIESITSDTNEKQYWDEVLSARILSKLETIDSAGLGSLASLEAELPILARQVCTDAEALTVDRLGKLSEVLYYLMMDVLSIYNPALVTEFSSALHATNTADVVNLSEIGMQDNKLFFNMEQLWPNAMLASLEKHSKIDKHHLVPSLAFLVASKSGSKHTRRAHLANAWVQFSVALIKLFVPDKAYDPQLKSVLGLQGYRYRLDALNYELELLRKFEKFQTGQSTNLRCELLEEEIAAVGPPPSSVQAVYRPADHQLSNIQTEFNNLLKVILKSDLSVLILQHCSGSDSATQELDVIRDNLSRIADRLKHEKYRAYEDIVSPVINMIHCLEIGLYLGRKAGSGVTDGNRSSRGLLDLAPLLGGKLNLPAIQPAPSQSFEFLCYTRMVVAVEGPSGLERVKQGTFQAIHSLYDQWAQKLEADKKAEESKRSWYRYRGGLDEEEAAEQEAFDELFPSFDEDAESEQSKIPKVGDARALAIRLAQVHKDIFLTPQDAVKSIISLDKDFARKVSENADNSVEDKNLLSVVLLSLDEKLRDISSNANLAEYNFYTDRNLLEARKLLSLVNEIRARFQQLRQVDEIGHLQPLIDLGHSDPLASTIPKVEQLHAFVYEWQFGGWASKTYGVLPLYNRLTDLLVGWRRLELSTWGKLFDMEVKKNDEDASSWWFIAYQAIIAAPLTLAQAGEDLSQHISGLLRELETYFFSAPVGQFSSRLGLLKQLHKQVELIVVDYPSMSVIRDGLHNFIGFYSRYTKAVDDLIRAGRTPLEKKMKDVLLLASWKDTNIVALRESARKSHHKLFRIVKKFREVLGQPMKPIIENGLPDEAINEARTTDIKTEISSIDKSAVKLCSEDIPNWGDEYRRLANVQRTTEIMSRLSRIPESAMDAGEAINSFLSNLEDSAAELRKETPGTLTEENKALVKHLKSRKRKLFAETLKEARQMGFQYNLSTDVLSQQAALSTVLATSDTLASQAFQELKNTDYYFHKMLDLAPQVRRAYNEHSDDLTTAEVDRSIGFLEGVLHVTLNQRRGLAKALKHYDALAASSRYIHSLSELQGGDKIKTTSVSANHERVCAWAVQIIKVGRHLIELHAKFGNLDHKELLHRLDDRLSEFTNLSSEWKSLPVIPGNLTSVARSHLETRVSLSLNQFRDELDDGCRKWPALAFLLEQISLWTIIDEQSVSASTVGTKQLEAVLYASKSLCDSILVTIEQLNKTMTKLPGSQEEAGWLVKHGEVMADSLRVLHMDKVEKGMTELFALFAQINLADNSVNRISTALMAVLAPIVDQYQVACNQTVETFARTHKNTCKLGYKLSKSFTQLSSQGFCTPQEKSDEKSGETGELESGTGLGEGEGAEDISKDIQPDEDLSELAQEKNQESKQEMEEEKDAVDMADQELEGDAESVDGGNDDEKGSQSGDEDESGDEMDEEAGEMWDGEDEEDAEKDQQGENAKGQKKKDEQIAAEAQPDTQEVDEGEDGSQGDENPDENPGAEENEDVQQQEEANMQDQNVQEQDTLALPDDMNIDGDDNDSMSSLSDDELDKLSDVDQEEQKDKHMSDQESETNEDVDMETAPPDAGNDNEEMDEIADQDEEARIEEDEQAEEPEQDTEEQETAQVPSNDEANAANEDAAPSDVKGGGQDLDPNQTDEVDNTQSNAAQRENGEMGENAADQDTSAGKKGSTQLDDTKDSPTQKWHRQQQEIKEAQEQDTQEQSTNAEPESTIKEFQHIQNDESAADTQAMGTSNEEQKQQIDESMAIDEDEQATDSRIIPEDEAEADDVDADADKMDVSEPQDTQGQQDAQKEERPSGESLEEVEEEIQETSTQLSSTHLSEPSLELRDFDETMQQWTSFQSKTHPLSLSLTSQLRKRLNIKHKIWMRRAIPTKRSYQILLCVDDSKSMGESSSGELALESLVGQIGFTEPFASHDAGAKVLQKFTFQQDYTDIQLLIKQTIERFRLARLQSTSRGSEDLWQLALILSDGLTPSAAHEHIRVLLREAMEERIMIVFIIMDDTASGKDKDKQSVVNLKKVRFMGNDEIRTEYYLDTFPFQYYLIVHNLEDLPGALAGLLRTWFAEVNS
ncbi:uncharacterized protein F4812DRAFT_450474 [Daldinia caldariorum]|uniref:uncharacterized protein n=1 Tax=Daldinia caldariorum TaxID=326644 RepID=UPI002007367F|nr:uncharacterized protein F4812DRAFT_450474 [Daldinia caldariorum]KAI1469192.1 hypothetical protein F4812DRAFT_450474 [Daldinia caldariorum]